MLNTPGSRLLQQKRIATRNNVSTIDTQGTDGKQTLISTLDDELADTYEKKQACLEYHTDTVPVTPGEEAYLHRVPAGWQHYQPLARTKAGGRVRRPHPWRS